MRTVAVVGGASWYANIEYSSYRQRRPSLRQNLPVLHSGKPRQTAPCHVHVRIGLVVWQIGLAVINWLQLTKTPHQYAAAYQVRRARFLLCGSSCVEPHAPSLSTERHLRQPSSNNLKHFYSLRLLTLFVIGHNHHCCTDDIMHPWFLRATAYML